MFSVSIRILYQLNNMFQQDSCLNWTIMTRIDNIYVLTRILSQFKKWQELNNISAIKRFLFQF